MTLQERESVWLPAILHALLAFVVSGFLLRFADYVTSDGVEYLRLAENLFSGKGISVNLGEPYLRHPPFYSFLVGLANLIWHNLEFSGHFVSMLSFSFTLIPLFLLARDIYSENTAHWVSFLFVTHGLLLSYSNLIMTEALFILLIFTQLYLVHNLIQKGGFSYSSAVILGSAGGSGFLTRPEGLLFYLAGLTSFLFLSPKPWSQRVRFCLLSLAVFLLFFLPYTGFVSRATGHLQFSGLAREVIIYRQLDLSHPGQYLEVKKIYEGLSGDRTRLKIDELVDQFSLLHYLKADDFALIRGGFASIPLRLSGLSNYLFGGLGFLLVGASWVSIPWDTKRKKAEFLLMAFVAAFLPHLFLLFYPRRFVALVPFFLLWMGNGMNVLTHGMKDTFHLGKGKQALAVSILCLLFLSSSVWYLRRVLPKGDFPLDDKALGFWVKGNIPSIQEEKVAGQDRFFHFYSGAKILKLPYVEKFDDFLTYMAHQGARYFVVSEDLEVPVIESYRFLLDESKPSPPGISRRYTLKGQKKKMILYEIER